MLRGVRAFMGSHDNWAVHLTEQGRGAHPPRWLKRWEGDGIIARIENASIEAAVREKSVPIVNVSASGLGRGLHTFISDSAEVGRYAAEHLLERGLEHYGYLGDSRFVWSAEHGKHFRRHLRKAGFSCSIFPTRLADGGDWKREQLRIGKWIQALPKPVGIMVNYDIRGQQLLDVCRDRGIRVPDEVAVIGQHNDELLCELCEPPLSSVIPNPRRTGFEAASTLNSLMGGRHERGRIHRIQPLGVATRRSTDVVAVEDRQLAFALKYIRENACQGISVADVLRRQPMSRTLLERKFKQYLRRTPLEEINRHRLSRAKELLGRTRLPMATIAERAGFSTAEYFSAVFKKWTGLSPARFRANVIGSEGSGVSEDS